MVGMWITRCGVLLDRLVSLCNGDSDQLRQERRRAELKTLSEQNGRAAAEIEEVGVMARLGMTPVCLGVRRGPGNSLTQQPYLIRITI